MAKPSKKSSNKVVNYAVDPAEVPSSKWGWSVQSVKTYRIVAVVTIISLLALLKGNHQGRVEDLYLVGIASIFVFYLVADIIKRRKISKK